MPGVGVGDNSNSMRAQTRASATDGFSTIRKSWLALGAPLKFGGSSTRDARVPATSGLYLALPKKERSPGPASVRAARPRMVSVVTPRVETGWTMAAISAAVNDTCMPAAWRFRRAVQFSKQVGTFICGVPRTPAERRPYRKTKNPARERAG